MRTTTLLFVCLLAAGAAGCSSGGTPEKETVTVTATPSPAAPLVLSPAEAKAACSAAVAEAAPGWADWNIDPGGWQTDPRTPKECLALAVEGDPSAGNRAFMGALLEGLEAADDPRARS